LIKTSFTEEKLHGEIYSAPELLQELWYDYKVDIWSLGCVAYLLFIGKHLFTAATKDELL